MNIKTFTADIKWSIQIGSEIDVLLGTHADAAEMEKKKKALKRKARAAMLKGKTVVVDGVEKWITDRAYTTEVGDYTFSEKDSRKVLAERCLYMKDAAGKITTHYEGNVWINFNKA
tara:strand:- start:3828 stop:4175 length:348 start_codon:yes stop_codon:yes gene_type:complete